MKELSLPALEAAVLTVAEVTELRDFLHSRQRLDEQTTKLLLRLAQLPEVVHALQAKLGAFASYQEELAKLLHYSRPSKNALVPLQEFKDEQGSVGQSINKLLASSMLE